MELALALTLFCAAPAGDALTVRVTHHDGEAATGATVVVHDGERALGKAVTDALGCAVLPALTREATLVVAGASWEAHREVLSPGVAEVDVSLPEGEDLRGWVIVDVAVPTEPVEIVVTASRRYRAPDDWLRALPDNLHYTTFGRDPLRQRTDAEGRFRVSGLPEGWRGWIRFPHLYELASENGTTRVSAGAVLERRLVTLPALRGEVVDATTGRPIPDTSIRAQVCADVDDPPGVWEHQGDTDSHGRFQIPVGMEVIVSGPDSGYSYDILHDTADGRARWVELEISDTETGCAGVVRLEDVDLSNGHDFGALRLLRPPPLTLEVADEEGHPVSGAVAFWGIGQRRKSEPTDDRGRVAARAVPYGVDRVWVIARGYEMAVVDVAANRDVRTRVVLRRAATLEIRVGTDVDHVDVHVRGPSFFGTSRVLEMDRAGLCSGRGGIGSYRSSGSWKVYGARFEVERGAVVVYDIATDSPVTTKAGDRSRRVRLARGEHRVLDLSN